MGKGKGKPSDRDYFMASASHGFAKGQLLDEKQGQIKEMLERYGVEGSRSVRPGHRGMEAAGREHREYDEVKKDLQKAMMNDYDTRRGMEAAALAGDKKARKFAEKGISEGNMYRAYGKLKDLKKEHVGGGSMIGPDNEAGLTMSLVDYEREKQTEGYEEKFASQDFLDKKMKELEGKFKTKKDDETPVEYSDSEEFAAAKKRLDSGEYEDSTTSMFNPGPSSPTIDFNKQNDQVPARDDQETATKSYLDQYKKDLIKGGRLEEAATDNLNNAYNTVINSNI